MANAIYTNLKNRLLAGSLVFDTASIMVSLVNAGYTFSAAHTDWSTISSNVVGTPQTLSSTTVSGQTEVGGDTNYTGVAASLTVKAIIIWEDQGGGDGDLLLYFDTGTGLPLTTDGNVITIHWNNTTPTGNIWGF
jgi:hypothetical protein